MEFCLFNKDFCMKFGGVAEFWLIRCDKTPGKPDEAVRPVRRSPQNRNVRASFFRKQQNDKENKAVTQLPP